ncbi:hypothetical protein HY642_00265 [Candidatus Woesearchaeota archaeon]|nr:hypothetical protein [Candidatus Woesearchaeota archaeon]
MINLNEFKPKKPSEIEIDPEKLSDFEKLLKAHNGATIAETKFDGYGAIVDNRNGLAVYSLQKRRWDCRNLPELARDAARLPKGFYMGELVGRKNKDNWSNREEFAAVTHRPLEKYDSAVAEQLAQEMPLELRLYDVLELRGKDVTQRSLRDRRKALEDAAPGGSILTVDQHVIANAARYQQMLLQWFDEGKEGFVVKDPESSYSGKRDKSWLKLKRYSTFDLLVLGLYQTEERLKQGWKCSNLLGGVINEETGLLETLSKVTVPSKAIAAELYGKLHEHLAYTWSRQRPYEWQNDKSSVKHDGSVVYAAKLPLRKTPFMYVKQPLESSIVVETRFLNVTTSDTYHTCGASEGKAHSLRQPVFVRFREKLPGEATTTRQVHDYVAKLGEFEPECG